MENPITTIFSFFSLLLFPRKPQIFSAIAIQMEPIDVQKPSTTLTSSSTAVTNAQMEQGFGGLRSPPGALLSPGETGTGTVSIATSREEEDSSNQNSSDCKSPGNR